MSGLLIVNIGVSAVVPEESGLRALVFIRRCHDCVKSLSLELEEIQVFLLNH